MKDSREQSRGSTTTKVDDVMLVRDEPCGLLIERAASTRRAAPLRWTVPLLAIWSMVTRLTEHAGLQGPEWAVTPEQALWMYTYGSAWCGFEEHVKGSLTPGKYADLVALSDDPRAVEPGAIESGLVEGSRL